MLDKIILGTAQIGRDYGLDSNEQSKSKSGIKKIFDIAKKNQINFFDTAPSYNDNQKIIKSFITSNTKIISKISKIPQNEINNKSIEKVDIEFEKSLEHLSVNSIDILLFHSALDITKPNSNKIIEWINQKKKQNKINKIGVSAYEKKEIDMAIDTGLIEVVQVPINILDQRLIKNDYLLKIKSKKIEVHARSIFLQGLLLIDIKNLPTYFDNFKYDLKSFSNKLNILKLSRLEACITFINNIKEIDRIILGVKSDKHLKQIIKIMKKIKNDFNFNEFSINNEKLLDPRKWNNY